MMSSRQVGTGLNICLSGRDKIRSGPASPGEHFSSGVRRAFQFSPHLDRVGFHPIYKTVKRVDVWATSVAGEDKAFRTAPTPPVSNMNQKPIALSQRYVTVLRAHLKQGPRAGHGAGVPGCDAWAGDAGGGIARPARQPGKVRRGIIHEAGAREEKSKTVTSEPLLTRHE